MIETVTVLKCDGPKCHRALIGCSDGHANREHNTLAKGRQADWRRVHDLNSNDQMVLRDLCPDCYVCWLLNHPEELCTSIQSL